MATDTTALAEAIRSARDAHTEFNAPSSNIVDVVMAASALGDLLAALSGVPERIALLEAAVEVAGWLADSCGTTQEKWDDSYVTVDTYSTEALTGMEAALDALDALDGEGANDGD